MDILLLEGQYYFFSHLQEYGGICHENEEMERWAIHGYESWECILSEIDKLPCRHTVEDIKLLRRTLMKNGKNNYLFEIER